MMGREQFMKNIFLLSLNLWGRNLSFWEGFFLLLTFREFDNEEENMFEDETDCEPELTDEGKIH